MLEKFHHHIAKSSETMRALVDLSARHDELVQNHLDLAARVVDLERVVDARA